MRRPLKIAIISPYFIPFPGGQEVHTSFLIKYLQKFNVKITLITTNKPKLEKYESHGNFVIHRLNPLFEFHSNPISIKLFLLLMKINVDIFHVQGYWSYFANIASIVSKIRKIPLVLTSHGFQMSLFTKNLISRMVVNIYLKTIGNFMFNQMKMISCNHTEDKEILNLIGINEQKIKIIPSGLDLEKYNKIRQKLTPEIMYSLKKKYNLSKPLILYIGRLVQRKGCQFLLKAIPEILKIYPELKFVIIGDGPEEKKFKSLASNLGLEKNVIFTGFIKPFSIELIFFLQFSDIQILPSVTESMPVSIMEGLYFGNIILFSDMYFSKWLKYKNKQIFIPIQPTDIQDISKKILYVLDNKENYENLIEIGRKFIEDELDWNVISHKTYRLYLKAIKN